MSSQWTVSKALIGSLGRRPQVPCGRLAALLAALLLAPAALWSEAADLRPWERVLVELDGRIAHLAADMDRIHRVLIAKARTEDPKLLDRLSPEPPRPRPWGYGLLPEITPSPEVSPAAVRSQTYSLEELVRWVQRSVDRAESLAAEASAGGEPPLEQLVARFENLRGELRNLEKNVSYHRFWQQAVLDDAAFFAERNRVLERVREWRSLEAKEGDRDRRDALRQEIARRVAPFHPTPGLVLEVDPDGSRILPVEVTTDITNAEFLEIFRSAVAEAFEQSSAAQSRRFRVRVEITRIPNERLYPDGPPRPGEPIDERDHLARFPEGALVLTTGAKSTHARTGRYIQLGPHPQGRRALAHEFAHLLGFDDGYLRAYEGSPDDPYGVVLIEWTGLLDDIMGAPGHGIVTEEMIDRMIQAYSEPCTAAKSRDS